VPASEGVVLPKLIDEFVGDDRAAPRERLYAVHGGRLANYGWLRRRRVHGRRQRLPRKLGHDLPDGLLFTPCPLAGSGEHIVGDIEGGAHTMMLSHHASDVQNNRTHALVHRATLITRNDHNVGEIPGLAPLEW
jgi:hypothetical protein